jgi:hypothetical protein
VAGAGVPTAVRLNCPRCKALRYFVSVDGGVTQRCGGCEWYFTLGTVAPTGTTNATRTAGQLTIPVASGGASFTIGMFVLVDVGSLAEVVQATATGSATSIPCTAYLKGHASGVAIGQLSVAPTYSAVGEDAVPAAAPWGF